MTFERIDPTEDPYFEELVQVYYRWWRISWSKDHLKLGPISIGWYLLPEYFVPTTESGYLGKALFVSVVWLCRYVWTWRIVRG